jgi:hypothetical protein
LELAGVTGITHKNQKMKMPLQYFIGAVVFTLLMGGKSPEPFPQTEITNGLIHARLYLPDLKEGYYRGSRFDWSGVIPELIYEGHSYFGQWFSKYSPTMHDAIMGPVQDFSPVGYDDAKTGETFLKIGIGMVAKPDEPNYFFANTYPLVNPGTWNITKKPDQVTFMHELNDKEYAYEYEKTVRLTKGKGEMVLSHSLKNTGKRTIESMVYDHNFFVMDGQASGPDFRVIFPFKISGDARKTADFGKTQDDQIVFLKELANRDYLQFESLMGYGNRASDYDIKIENHKTGAAVRITSDQTLAKLAFWSAPKTVCPEPFIHIKVKPGETFKWKINYLFYTCEITSR